MKDGSSNPLCSRNARPQKALVACAQWRITGSRPSVNRAMCKPGRIIPMVRSKGLGSGLAILHFSAQG